MSSHSSLTSGVECGHQDCSRHLLEVDSINLKESASQKAFANDANNDSVIDLSMLCANYPGSWYPFATLTSSVDVIPPSSLP